MSESRSLEEVLEWLDKAGIHHEILNHAEGVYGYHCRFIVRIREPNGNWLHNYRLVPAGVAAWLDEQARKLWPEQYGKD